MRDAYLVLYIYWKMMKNNCTSKNYAKTLLKYFKFFIICKFYLKMIGTKFPIIFGIKIKIHLQFMVRIYLLRKKCVRINY
jgi:hypothetical protein